MISNTQSAVNEASTSLRQFAQKTQGEKGQLNKNDFLNLFMTQVSNQDPLNPMDSSGMMTQMAQLGAMEQLQNLNTKMETMSSQQQDMIKLGAQSYLGLEVAYTDNTIHTSGGKASGVTYKLPEDVNGITANITNTAGETVKQISIGQKPKGEYTLDWDATNDKNEKVTDGSYRVDFLATDKTGKEVPIDVNRTRRVERVGYENNNPVFYVGDRKMTLKEINMFDRKVAGQFLQAVPFGFKDSNKVSPMLGTINAGASGVKAHNASQTVTGSNIANVNTVGYKKNRVGFQDLIKAHLNGSPDEHPQGVQIQSVKPIFQQGTFELTGEETDMSIDGGGFFIMKDEFDRTYYTRNGDFKINEDGMLTNMVGDFVMVKPVDEKTKLTTGMAEPINLYKVTLPPKQTGDG
ncbi:hypothetical protein CHS0354_026764 [Potamilus streckersoni]|uniref:Basal-body rod modification protein FlgD n=1 Tax=Potamilus streckersoni TaxID=2493646 RepID=A0AAE0T641_9BIVA|nr:hypothetical protein CHS0354_026764 [Potamilus streckersoni]